MSAILSADTLNDYISPSLECIKPVETLPKQLPNGVDNAYEVTTEDKLPSEAAPAGISLTDCLACSGCVTSAEAVLISLQSHAEVLDALDSGLAFTKSEIEILGRHGAIDDHQDSKRIFVASVSPQVRASLAVTYGITQREAGHMIEQLLCGPQGLSAGGRHGNRFAWTIDTNAMREVCLDSGVDEVLSPSLDTRTSPTLTSACPGWVCYVEKTHPHVLQYLSKLKSPQALTGIMLKTVLSKKLRIKPSQIFHLAIMPCFDKKLEGSRQELTDKYWHSESEIDSVTPIRDVDCVITAREILMLADSRGISFPSLSKEPLHSSYRLDIPDAKIASFILPKSSLSLKSQSVDAGTSGGYLQRILQAKQHLHPGSTIQCQRGRNSDVVDYSIVLNNETIFRAARYYGFRNIQNLVRKLKPARVSKLSGKPIGNARKPNGSTGAGSTASEYAYVEVMACPGGCTNGGGQIKLDDLGTLQSQVTTVQNQKEWLALVDEAYYSMDSSDENEECGETANGLPDKAELAMTTSDFLAYWSSLTQIPVDNLLRTTFREVQSDVGKVKNKKPDTERVAEIAARMGGGW